MKRQAYCAALAAAVFLAGCQERVTAPDDGAPQEAPSVAPTMPATVSDPDATSALRSFEGRDANRDSLVTGAENGAAEAKIFRAIDVDGDGAMTVAELDRARLALGLVTLPGSEALISDGDQDGDGKLTLAEWIARESESFDAADADKDGNLTRGEFSAQPRLEPSRMGEPLQPSASDAGAG